MNDARRAVLEALGGMVRAGEDRDRLLREAVRLVHDSGDRYDWTGIYLREGEELVLHNHLGRPTPHARIPLGQGICGAAARARETIVVPDVLADQRYLACSLETRSEIVVPLFHLGFVVGELDLDSDTPDAFTEDDRRFLEAVASLLGDALGGPCGRVDGPGGAC